MRGLRIPQVRSDHADRSRRFPGQKAVLGETGYFCVGKGQWGQYLGRTSGQPGSQNGLCNARLVGHGQERRPEIENNRLGNIHLNSFRGDTGGRF